jgi:hypothetical protein
LPANTSTTEEGPLTPGLPPGLLALFQSRSTHDNSLASRPNATSTAPHYPQPRVATVANGLGLDHEKHYAAIPPRPEPLPPQTRQPGLAAPRVQAQQPLRMQPEPEPAMITSDIVEASTHTPPAAPPSIAHHGPQPAAATAAGGDSNLGSTAATSDTPDQKRRDALRMALKSKSCPL